MKNARKKPSSIMIFTARNRRWYLTGLLWAAPFLIGAVIFLLAPFLRLTWGTLFRGGGRRFAGFDNYREVFASEAFRMAALHTVLLLAVSLICIISIGVLLALFLKSIKDHAPLVMAAGLVPFLMPALAAVMAARFICPDSLWSLCLMHLWKYAGFYGVLLAAAMNQIPDDYYEAAEMEGAGYWKQVRIVTLPCIREMMGFAVILGVVHTFLGYREALLLAGTHPPGQLYLIQHYISNNFEQMNQMHLSVAAVSVVFAMCLCVGVIWSGRRWLYGKA